MGLPKREHSLCASISVGPHDKEFVRGQLNFLNTFRNDVLRQDANTEDWLLLGKTEIYYPEESQNENESSAHNIGCWRHLRILIRCICRYQPDVLDRLHGREVA